MRLIYAVLMLAGFALLLWSIDQSMPVYAYDAEEICVEATENGKWISVPCPAPLKECEEALSACEAQLDSCRPNGFEPPLYYEDHPVIRR